MDDTKPPAGAHRVLLLGLMGSGKTSVGAALTELTGWPYLDNDTRIQQRTGQTLAEYAGRGQRALHDLEADLAMELLDLELLDLDPPFVAGVAASVVVRPAVVERLRTEAFAVYLRASVDTLLDRLGDGIGRPWLADDPRGFLERATAEREPGFLLAASLVVDVDSAGPSDVAKTIRDALPQEHAEQRS